MKFKRFRNVMAILGFGFLAIAVALFFTVPFIVGEGYDYVAFKAFATGAKAVFSFNFSSITYCYIAFALATALLCIIWWMMTSIINKKPKHLFAAIFTFGALFVIAALAATYYYVSSMINGESMTMISFLREIAPVGPGRTLLFLVTGLGGVSLMFLIIYIFVDLLIVILKDPEVVLYWNTSNN